MILIEIFLSLELCDHCFYTCFTVAIGNYYAYFHLVLLRYSYLAGNGFLRGLGRA